MSAPIQNVARVHASSRAGFSHMSAIENIAEREVVKYVQFEISFQTVSTFPDSAISSNSLKLR